MIAYLWQNRLKPPFGSALFFKVWAKRALTAGALLKANRRHGRMLRGGAEIGGGTLIGEARFLGRLSNLKIGQDSALGRAEVMLHGKCSIGSFVCINDGVHIITATHDVSDPSWTQISKPVVIGDHAWIATNAMILPGVEIGEGAVVGAGAVVTKHVPAFSIVTGNPAQALQKRRSSKLAYSPVRFVAFQEAWLGPPSSYP